MKTKKQKTSENLKISAKKFKNEFKKSTNTALVAAFGLIMAFAWKDVLAEYLNSIVQISPLQGKLISALIITFVSVAGIFIVTKFLSVKE